MKMNQKTTDLVKQVVAMLMALMLFLGTIGLNSEYLTPDSIEQFGVLLGALIAFGATIYGIYMNTFYKKSAFKKAEEKEAQRLIDEGAFDPEENVIVEPVDAPDGVEDGADLK